MEVESKTRLECWWLQLVWESEREFISPYNLDECVKRLKALSVRHDEERSSFFNTVRFYIRNIEDEGDYFSFKMDIHMNKVGISAELFGQLIYKDESTTEVKLRYGYTLGSIISLILLLPFLYIFSFIIGATSTVDLLILFGIYLFALFIQISFGYGLKPELYHEVHKELAGDKQTLKAN